MNRDITYCTNSGCPLRKQCIRNSDTLDAGRYSIAKFEYDYEHNLIICEKFVEVQKDGE